jgi:hypothetical protein
VVEEVGAEDAEDGTLGSSDAEGVEVGVVEGEGGDVADFEVAEAEGGQEAEFGGGGTGGGEDVAVVERLESLAAGDAGADGAEWGAGVDLPPAGGGAGPAGSARPSPRTIGRVRVFPCAITRPYRGASGSTRRGAELS